MAGAAVVTATIGPGGTAAATEEETTMVAVGEPALLGAMVATAGLMVTSEGAGQAGANTVLSGHSALPTAASAVLGGGETFPVWPVHTASTAPAAFSSSSLSDPPEELLSEATRGAFLVTHTFQAQGEVGPKVFSGPGLWPPSALLWSMSTGELHRGPVSEQQKGWKSVNLAQPFSSTTEGPAAHALEPTSLAAPGVADSGFTGSSKTAVHVVPAESLSERGPSFCVGDEGAANPGTFLATAEPVFLSWPPCSKAFFE